MSDSGRPRFGSRKSDLAAIAGILIAVTGLLGGDNSGDGTVLVIVGILLAIPGLVAIGIRMARDESGES